MTTTTQTKTTTSNSAIPRLFGLEGDGWLRHANPVSVWTRFAALPLIILAIWSRDWIGWLSLVPITLSVVWMAVNPLFFRPPKSTDNWASKSVLGERIWTESDRATLPRHFRTQWATVAQLYQTVGLGILTYGLIVLDPLATVAGLFITQGGKAWFLDRMVLLYEGTSSDEQFVQ